MRALAVHAVSPAARSVSVSVMPIASNTCHSALITSIDAADRDERLAAARRREQREHVIGERARRAIAIAPFHTIVHASVSLTCGHTLSAVARPIAWPARIAPADASPNAGMNAIELTAITTLSAATVIAPSFATTTLTNRWNAANSRNQLSPFGRPNRATRHSSRRDRPSGACAFGAPPQPRQNATARNAKPSQRRDHARERGAVDAVDAGSGSQLPITAVTIVITPAIICIHVLPSPPYQLPSASMPTPRRPTAGGSAM